MLTSVRILSFKSVADATIHLSPVGVLIGANAAGKSNVIEGLVLLSWLAQGRLFADLPHALGTELPIRGRLEELFGAVGEIGFECRVDEMKFELGVRLVDGQLVLAYERLWSASQDKVPLYAFEAPALSRDQNAWVAYNDFARGGTKPQLMCTRRQIILSQLLSPAQFHHKRSKAEIPKASRA